MPCTQTVAVADGTVIIAPEILAWSSVLPSGRQWFDRKSYDAAYRAALDAVTAGLSVHDLKEWLKGAEERWHLNYVAICTARRGDNETTMHGLTIFGPVPKQEVML